MEQRDSEDLSFTVLRHCVARGEGDLSPLQMRILHNPKPVRIFSAPTGAGKSYALVRAAAAGQRVLFVVPTRRLAQNLAAAAIEELSAPGMAPGAAESLVALWSSDETARLRAECPDVRIGRLRVRQTRGLGSNARFIVATPESIAFMLLWALRPGYADLPFCLADLVVNFDHIVFDEFHTIDARGFGLCAVVARAVAAAGGAKLTFLSATPIDVLPVLSALGLPGEAVAVAAETVVTEAADSGSGLRAVHGDVEIHFCSHLRMLDLLETHAAALRECLLRGRQIVVILDSLDTLHVNKRDFAAFFDRLGVPAAKRLAINSVDDSATPDVGGAFVTDRYADPVTFQVLLATSSVEMGVTFKAGVIVMDPGHDALSFVQRVGRVARGDERGLVLVRYDAGATSRKPWLREIIAALQQEPTPRALTVDRFLEIVLRATRQRFTTREKLDLDEPPRDFRAMPARAVWAAALFFMPWSGRSRLPTGASGKPWSQFAQPRSPASPRCFGR